MKLVYIEWADAVANDSAKWYTMDGVLEWADESDCVVREVGFVIKENKKEMVLASRTQSMGKDYETQYGLLQKIPKTWIRKMKVIKLNQKANSKEE